MSGHKQLIIDVCTAHNVLRNQCAYVLATADWETNHTFNPVKEAYWVKNAERWRRKNLRYYPWYGRGFAQLTWEENYLKAGKKIGVDLIKNPDAAMEPKNAVKILVIGMIEGWFTGKKLSDYITLQKSQFSAARRIINGTDKKTEIAALARKYDKELKAAGYGVTERHEGLIAGGKDTPRPMPPKSTKPTPTPPQKPKASGWVAILKAILSLFKKG